ncbi:MAG: arylesterase [Gammaproteobacteria bacterium]|nr:arylesterase [Gammaproteobacteria bacterium]
MRRFLLGLLLVATTLAAATRPPTLLVWGDSLAAGYGLDQGQGWVSLLAKRLQKQGPAFAVVNGSVSGETTAGGLARLPAALERWHPAVVLIELGGNDGLRGLSLTAMRDNLRAMIDGCRAAGAEPALMAMRIPTNYGPAYSQAFAESFTQVAHAEQVRLIPFFLAAIAADRSAFQPDGIHPNAAAQPKLLEALWPTLKPVLHAVR